MRDVPHQIPPVQGAQRSIGTRNYSAGEGGPAEGRPLLPYPSSSFLSSSPLLLLIPSTLSSLLPSPPFSFSVFSLWVLLVKCCMGGAHFEIQTFLEHITLQGERGSLVFESDIYMCYHKPSWNPACIGHYTNMNASTSSMNVIPICKQKHKTNKIPYRRNVLPSKSTLIP